MGQAAVDDLIELLDLEAIEVNIFRGRSPAVKRQRVFGGQVAGQALVAAARTATLDLLFTGALVQVGIGHLSYDAMADRLREAAALTMGRHP